MWWSDPGVFFQVGIIPHIVFQSPGRVTVVVGGKLEKKGLDGKTLGQG